MASNYPLHYTAPAKVNLTLRVTGKRDDGYHILHSLTMFTHDVADELSIEPADQFCLTQESDFDNFPPAEDNLITKTARKLAALLNQNLNCHIHLKKNIPMGAGLGGGSSDVATAVKMLLDFWGVDMSDKELNDFLLSIGADVPVCYHTKPCVFEGVGEIITPLHDTPDLHAVLIYPNQHSSTIEVFKQFEGPFTTPTTLPTDNNFLEYIAKGTNDLCTAAIDLIPDIQDVLDSITAQPNCILSRMSGSGSCCFGLFNTVEQSQQAANIIQKENPHWWVRPVLLDGKT